MRLAARKPLRSGPGREDHETSALAGRPDQGEVARPAFHLQEAEGPVRPLEVNGYQELLGLDARRQRTQREVGGGHQPAAAAGGGDLQLGVQKQGQRRPLGRRVHVCQRAPDRAPAADLEVTDVREGGGDDPG